MIGSDTVLCDVLRGVIVCVITLTASLAAEFTPGLTVALLRVPTVRAPLACIGRINGPHFDAYIESFVNSLMEFATIKTSVPSLIGRNLTCQEPLVNRLREQSFSMSSCTHTGHGGAVGMVTSHEYISVSFYLELTHTV